MKKYLLLSEKGEIREIFEEDYKDTYKMLSDNVNGYIECVSWIPCFRNKGIDLWVNEEGKLNNLLPTIALLDEGKVIECLCGNIFFARSDDEGKTVPLLESDIDFIKQKVAEAKGYLEFLNPFTGIKLCNTVSAISM